MESSSSAPHMTCVLQVDTQTPGWHKTMIKVLGKISELSYSIDAQRGLAQCSGQVDPDKLLKALQKAGKHADLLWVRHSNSSSSSSTEDNNQKNNNINPTAQMGGYYDNAGLGSYGGGYGGGGYYNYPNYSYDPYMYGPRSGYNPYNQYHQDPYLDYHSYHPYHQPPAMYFPQAPPPIKNPRMVGYFNMM